VRLYQKPERIIEARTPGEVWPALIALRDGGRRGLHAAGFIAYEAGYALEPKLSPLSRPAGEGEPPLLWFGLFEGFEETEDASRLLPDASSAWLSPPRPLLDQADYEARVEAVKEHIRAGDIYQANLTFQLEVRTAGTPLAIYSALRARGRGGHGGLVHTGTHWLVSCSPELFFTLERGKLTARPMKGTAARRPSPRSDEAAADALPADPKQRAENLMIVDLLRNDLSRVSKPGTVKVPSLFEIETYPTVHQLVSTVTSRVEEGVGPVDVIEAIFPCGSITGAPKIRAMEIIAGLETEPRGPYTGAIGSIGPDGEAAFNVAIRTLTLREGEPVARLGLGAGIVVDSRADDEWRECLVKGAFVASEEGFDLIETMRFDPHGGIAELERHLQRMKKSAELFGYPFDRHAVRNELQAATFRLAAEKKLRLLLSKSGAIAIEARPMPTPPAEPVAVKLAPLPVNGEDFRLRHKSSRRAFYDEARRASGAFEVIFEDPDGFLSEGSFSSLFVERDGRLLTPPLARGLLPGILREKLIEEGQAVEAELKAGDLRDGFYIGNAVRGLIRATLAGTMSSQ
jgi:para-aminobenzoate synthetase / 4-amino-4-deoxychorismate lyase